MVFASYESLYIIGMLLITAILVVVIFGISAATKHLRTPEARGARGEQKVAYMLADIQSREGGYIINDVTIPSYKAHAQIDHIYFSRRGIFVVETKNYSGRVYGREGDPYWTQVLAYGEQKYKMYNPIKQNIRHIYALRMILGSNIELTSLVVFAKGTTRFIKSDQVYTVLEAKEAIRHSPIKYDEATIKRCYDLVIAHRMLKKPRS